jgi:hypothetical protein
VFYPVFAMEMVPGSLECLAVNSSGMHPPFLVITSLFSKLVYLEPASGPPVPAIADLGSLE